MSLPCQQSLIPCSSFPRHEVLWDSDIHIGISTGIAIVQIIMLRFHGFVSSVINRRPSFSKYSASSALTNFPPSLPKWYLSLKCSGHVGSLSLGPEHTISWSFVAISICWKEETSWMRVNDLSLGMGISIWNDIKNVTYLIN